MITILRNSIVDDELIITPELLEHWPDEELISFLLDEEIVRGTPKADLILIAQELATRYNYILEDEEYEEDPDDPIRYNS